MDKLNLLFYYYIHVKIKEKFGGRSIVCCSDVENFIANKFRTPRQLKKKVLLDLQALGLVEIYKGNRLKINDKSNQALYL